MEEKKVSNFQLDSLHAKYLEMGEYPRDWFDLISCRIKCKKQHSYPALKQLY